MGLQEAFELAKSSNNPGAMTGAYREIAKMCGYYEPEKKQIEINQAGRDHIKHLDLLSDEELFEKMGGVDKLSTVNLSSKI
jgi:hypothetical protein